MKVQVKLIKSQWWLSADHSKLRISGSIFTPQVKVQERRQDFNLKSSEEEKPTTPT